MRVFGWTMTNRTSQSTKGQAGLHLGE
jgi:hypothetical protein